MADNRKVQKKQDTALKAGVPPDKSDINKIEKMFQSATKMALYCAALGITGLLVAGIVFFTRPIPQTYAIYPDGRLIEMTPISDEIPPDMIVNIVSSAILTGLRFDFANHKSQISRIKDYMSAEGYQAFVESIRGIESQAEANRYVASTDIIQPTLIGKSMVRDGYRIYKTTTVVLVSLEGQTSRVAPVKWLIEGIVRRVPQTENPRGYVVDAFVIKPYSESK